MSEGPGEGEFRVTDRRRRVDEPEPQSPGGEPVASGPASTVEAARAPSEEPPPGRAEISSPEETREPDRGERGLEGLFVMLASSAVVALGQAADPMTGKARDKDPAAAADAIDLLVLLREKTEGNRTVRETQLLDELIYDLQLRYVAETKPRL
jgi:hypothetical protein